MKRCIDAWIRTGIATVPCFGSYFEEEKENTRMLQIQAKVPKLAFSDQINVIPDFLLFCIKIKSVDIDQISERNGTCEDKSLPPEDFGNDFFRTIPLDFSFCNGLRTFRFSPIFSHSNERFPVR
jgi:hypothetical protein